DCLQQPRSVNVHLWPETTRPGMFLRPHGRLSFDTHPNAVAARRWVRIKRRLTSNRQGVEDGGLLPHLVYVAIKLKIPTAASGARRGVLPRDPIVRAALLAFLSISLLVVGFFSYWYVKYDRIIEQRFRDPVFTNSAKIYAGPHVVRVGS